MKGWGIDRKDGRMEAVEDFASRRAQEVCAPAAVLELEVRWAAKEYQLSA
jgi:hypothetical protein